MYLRGPDNSWQAELERTIGIARREYGKEFSSTSCQLIYGSLLVNVRMLPPPGKRMFERSITLVTSGYATMDLLLDALEEFLCSNGVSQIGRRALSEEEIFSKSFRKR